MIDLLNSGLEQIILFTIKDIKFILYLCFSLKINTLYVIFTLFPSSIIVRIQLIITC